MRVRRQLLCGATPLVGDVRLRAVDSVPSRWHPNDNTYATAERTESGSDPVQLKLPVIRGDVRLFDLVWPSSFDFPCRYWLVRHCNQSLSASCRPVGYFRQNRAFGPWEIVSVSTIMV